MTFASAAEKRAFTRDLFARLAARYELTNQVLSLGCVGAWRRAAAAEAHIPPGGWVLDVAVGDGGLARALLQRWPGVQVVGVDFAPEMMLVGRARLDGQTVHWAEGDALQLPFPDSVFDTVVSGFVLRNIVDVDVTFTEQVRVLRPGGRVVCLEMAWPRGPLFRPFFRAYFDGLAPLMGWLLTGQLDAYRYLPRSVKAFLSPEELIVRMERAGLRQVRYRTLMMGTITLHVGVRDEN
jgi:demethylmenaquinone methyltransferase/2-methoxy-6-polyprenyl-1,4-benzoquinol methylase